MFGFELPGRVAVAGSRDVCYFRRLAFTIRQQLSFVKRLESRLMQLPIRPSLGRDHRRRRDLPGAFKPPSFLLNVSTARIFVNQCFRGAFLLVSPAKNLLLERRLYKSLQKWNDAYDCDRCI
jgi:hypothetical protein